LDNNISQENIVNLIKNIQIIVGDIHKAGCLAVDLNELNILVDYTWEQPFFIDVDSFQTSHFPATAIMESIIDRKANGNWTTKKTFGMV